MQLLTAHRAIPKGTSCGHFTNDYDADSDQNFSIHEFTCPSMQRVSSIILALAGCQWRESVHELRLKMGVESVLLRWYTDKIQTRSR